MQKVNTQLELEKQNHEIMIEKTVQLINKSIKQKSVSDLPQSANVIPYYVEELTRKLSIYLATILSGKARVTPVSAKTLSMVPVKLVAHFTVKAIVDNIGAKNVDLTKLRSIIGKWLEVEYNLKELSTNDRKKATRLLSIINDSNHKGERKIKQVGDLLSKYHKDVITQGLSSSFQQVALLAIHELSECRPIVNNNISPVLFHMGTINKTKYGQVSSSCMVYPSTWFLEWLRQQTLEGNMLVSMKTALIEPPKDWTGLEEGGFHSPELKNRLIKTFIGPEEFNFNAMKNTIDAVNSVQRTPWEINEEIFQVMQYVFVNRLSWGNFPSPQKVMTAEYPFPNLSRKDMNDEQKEVADAWRKHHARLHDEHASESSKYMALNRALNEAKRFKQYDKFFFAYQVDFRGRLYPMAGNLHPQGNEHIKALLRFNVGKVLQDETAVKFLCVQGANTFGKDKINFEDKYLWVLANEKAILESANNPYENQFWLDADEPWLFLAFCFEWKGYKKAPKTFLSRLPIALDGSCNGLQHLSALLFDEVGGKSVNLTANVNKADIYQDVCDSAVKALEELNSDLAQKILKFGISRKTTKRAVMIVPYAGTLSSCREYITEELKERNADMFFGPELKDAITLLTATVWGAIGDTVIKGSEAMQWFKKAARITIKHSETPTVISWSTPNGFQVKQNKTEVSSQVISTSLGDKVRATFSFVTDTDRPDVARHATSLSPNFIHALDACCLQNTVNSCVAEGITNLAMIHDSYATHASDSARMARLIREEFFKVYKDGDVLDKWIKQQSIKAQELFPELPKKGNLNLESVLESEHFFA